VLPGGGREVLGGGSTITTTASNSGSSSTTVLDIERRHIVEEAERRCRGELEHMRREIDTLKESLKDQVDSEDVREILLIIIYYYKCTMLDRHAGTVVVWQEINAVAVARLVIVVDFVNINTGVGTS